MTRAGQFHLNNQGTIVTTDGDPIIPTITIPPNATAVTITPYGVVNATLAGQQNPSQLGQLQLATFPNPGGLESMGSNLLQATLSSGDPVLGNPGGTEGLGTLQQGYLENSNVDVVTEFVQMVLAQRAYESNSKVIKAADDMYSAGEQHDPVGGSGCDEWWLREKERRMSTDGWTRWWMLGSLALAVAAIASARAQRVLAAACRELGHPDRTRRHRRIGLSASIRDPHTRGPRGSLLPNRADPAGPGRLVRLRRTTTSCAEGGCLLRSQRPSRDSSRGHGGCRGSHTAAVEAYLEASGPGAVAPDRNAAQRAVENREQGRKGCTLPLRPDGWRWRYMIEVLG